MNNNNGQKGTNGLNNRSMSAGTSANYKSLSSVSASSSDQPIYRGLAHVVSAAPSIPKDFNERGMVAAQQAKQAANPSQSQSTAVLMNQDLEQARMKATKASNAVATKVESVSTTTSDDVFVARDFPILGFPLSQSYVVVSDPAKLDPAMKAIAKSLKGQSKPGKGSIKAQRENDTEIKVCAYRDTRTGKIYVEFNRLDGCAFIFQRAFVEAKLAAAEYVDGVDVAESKEELATIERKLSFWYGKESSLLEALLPGKAIIE